MNKPLLLVNCKNYGQTALLAERIARAAVQVLEERRSAGKRELTIALAVPSTDVYRVAGLGLVPVFSQHLDPHGSGATTGHVIAEGLRASGAVGAVINHSEDPFSDDAIRGAVASARRHGLLSVVCARDAQVAALVARFGPDFVAMEPPELIGGDVSVSAARPSLIADTVIAVKMVNDAIPILVGAGVKDSSDVKKGLELGAHGVLVASGVTKADDVVAVLRDLANGFD